MQSARAAALCPSWSDWTLAVVCWWQPRHEYVVKPDGWHVRHVAACLSLPWLTEPPMAPAYRPPSAPCC